jgi:hypothetical protein
MFRLERPNMAVNDPRVGGTAPPGGGAAPRRRFQMWNTWDISATELRAHIIEWVAAVAQRAQGGKLRHLVLSCHGLPGYLMLGEGFDSSHLPLFDQWNGLVEKLWLPNCLVARIPDPAMKAQLAHDYPTYRTSDGNVFCGEIARRIGGYVVAATETQCEYPSDVPPDMMTSFEGLVLSYGPQGNVTWSSRNRSMWMRTAPDGSQQCVPVPN